MPLLKFKCCDCSLVFDELVSLGATGNVACPSCESRKVERHYQGKCYFGKKSGDGSGSSCSGGNCSHCSGCGH
ncbi:MAG: FmdB family zinc ribbon protein [Christensenellales bacterium]|jgi:putative FmdB family regulatory protein